MSWGFALAPRPAFLPVALPEYETAKECAVTAGDMSPGPFAPAEYAHICKAHKGLAEGGEQGDGEDGMLCEVVAVAQAMGYKGYQPHCHVDDWVDEQNSQLALNCATALTQRTSADVCVHAACVRSAAAAFFDSWQGRVDRSTIY